MKKENQVKKHKNTDKGRIFVKVMAGILAILMIGGTAISLIYALMAN
ncbi:MAG: hypothetical protein IJH76_02715 [Clostridia bacterium]|nr:hypothetical protein [Clostridia bacterium]